MAKKGQKKKSIKLRKQIRKTLGSVCLITALLVAAIPVPEASAVTADGAGDDGTKYTWDLNQTDANFAGYKSVIPVVDSDVEEIYTTGDGTFQFAYIQDPNSITDWIAVVLGYSSRNLQNNYLEIPDTVDAYTKFSENEGTRTGYVAVSKSHKPLYYMSKEPEPILDVSTGNAIGMTEPEYSPCYYADYSKWSSLSLDSFYYKEGAEFKITDEDVEQWIKNLDVRYIGNQTLAANDEKVNSDGAVQEWIIAEEDGQINTIKENGIFANESNIKTLVVGESLMGIGNYAFYGCTNLESIKLGNGLTEIGKYAFGNCVNMSSVGIEFASKLQYISDYTFYNCQALESFVLPSSVTMICDHAFDGCTDLNNLDISGIGAGKNVTLAKIGYYAFKGCTSLTEVILPSSINSETVYLNAFQYCPNLKHIKAESPYTVFAETDNYKANVESDSDEENDEDDDFKKDVHSTFYFEALGESATHDFTEKHALAFKYADDDRYELIEIEKDTDGDGEPDSATGVKLTYQVNSNNELLYFNMDGSVANVELPANIGPYGISAINGGSFSGNCVLKKITIPATVSRINDGAFKGCHNLAHVIYEDASTITYIGSDAFATQKVNATCTHTLATTPSLTFTGTVGTGIVPYDYAMSASSTIHTGSQPKTYITYYSGWPTNQEIQYVVDQETGIGKATLMDYPTYDELAKGVNGKYTSKNYPYITDEYEDAAKEAISKYQDWLSDPNVEVTSNQWDIINAALELSVPAGVKAYATGLFSGVTGEVSEGADGKEVMKVKSVNGQAADTNLQKITFADIDEFAPYSFSGCTALARVDITGGTAALEDYAFASAYTNASEETGSSSVLTNINMSGGGSSIGDYAFCNNPELTEVTISALVDSMGVRPYKDCPELENVSFSGSPYFTCSDAIIYGLANGVKDSVVQCLESRGNLSTTGSVSAKELEGISSIAEEAFMDCTEVGSVDMSTTYVSDIPERAFANTDSLYSMILPTGSKSISKDAFDNSNIRYIEIPSSVTYIDLEAFNTPSNLNSDGKYNTIEFYCESGSAAETYAGKNENIKITDKPISTTFKVIFWGMDGAILDEQDILIGKDAVAPEAPEVEGYRFTGWTPANFTAVSRNMDIVAQYEKIDSSENMVTVTFLDWDDKVLKTDKVTPGNDAQPPLDPVRDGYTFIGWRPAVTNIQEDTTIYAQYEKNDSSDSQYTVRFIDWDDTVLYTQKVDAGADAISPQVPGRDGYEFTGWRPDVKNITKDLDTYAQYEKIGDGSGSGNGSGNGSGSGGDGDGDGDGDDDDGTSTKLYTLTVQNGSGSGSYAAGSQPIVIANDPASGMAFSHWTIDPDDTEIASKVLTATVITMPDENVTVTAHYKKSTGATVITGSGNSSNNNYRPGTNSGTIKNGGTTVVIDKNGLSNTGVVSATVNGSSDDFTIKITESNSATEAVIKALMAEYGDISNIKYFPMDISLYDSTGKKEITDTKGLSISITLPLPDSLITYAGNNKVAGVVNDKLDKLSPRFTTISGVSCVTFTAEHFSPYVIYVDTENLTAGTITDSTPKTGDGIHPKWFLSIGLACLSAVLFMKKDRKVPQKVRVRA